jgi:hypothetical protein
METDIRNGIKDFKISTTEFQERNIRLLLARCGTEGYWVFNCLRSFGHLHNGYYFDMNNEDVFKLFSIDTCNIHSDRVSNIIQTVITIGLFDYDISEKHKVLTNIEMQRVFIKSIKGNVADIKQEYLLI